MHPTLALRYNFTVFCCAVGARCNGPRPFLTDTFKMAVCNWQGRCAAVATLQNVLAVLPAGETDVLEARLAAGGARVPAGGLPATLASSYLVQLGKLGIKEARPLAPTRPPPIFMHSLAAVQNAVLSVARSHRVRRAARACPPAGCLPPWHPSTLSNRATGARPA